jgi:translocation and assembly module TamA
MRILKSLFLSLLVACGAVLPAQAAWRVDVQAPGDLAPLISQGLSLQRWLDSPYLDEAQFARLTASAPAEVRDLLATQGYFSPLVDAGVETRGADRVARIRVEPGPPTRVTSVEVNFLGAVVSDDTGRRLARLKRTWALPVGQVFTQAAWNNAKQALIGNLLNANYPAARFEDSRAEIDPGSQTARLAVLVDSGPAYRFGPLRVEGLQRYPVSLVKNMNTINAGTPYRQQALLDLQGKLVASGYFASVTVRADPDPQTGPALAPVVVTVVENPARQVDLALGYSTNTRYRAQAGYRTSNLGDSGTVLKSTLKLETLQQTLESELIFPEGERDIQYRYGATLKRADIEGEISQSLSLSGKRTQTRGKAEISQNLQYILERQILDGAPDATQQALVAGLGWTQHTLNSLTDPRRGHVLTLQAGGALQNLLSDQSFARLYARHVQFFSWRGRHTVSLRTEAGYVVTESTDGIPTDYLFRAGGDQSVRGYAFQSLGVTEGDATVGGRALVTASVEYLYRFNRNWGGALFYDIGDAAENIDNLALVSGYGIGARYQSPLGPIRVDLAYGESREELRLHFAVGIPY